MKKAISLQGIGKVFQIPHQKNNTLFDNTIHIIKNLSYENLEALKDIDLEIKKGEIVGIIGPNGSGKTVLLKIIADIIKPSTGKVATDGKVAPLLELGLGFEPELSGRENIFLSGAIMGLSKKEIKKIFDEIVDFADLKRFIDMPVKNYSAGMYARLAFALVIYTQGDIFLIDEIFSVGDAAFQKKCARLFDIMQRKGKTILFVSHDMSAIKKLCKRCIILKEGELLMDGPSYRVVDFYEKEVINNWHYKEVSDLKKIIKKTYGEIRSKDLLIGQKEETYAGEIEKLKKQMHEKERKILSLEKINDRLMGGPVKRWGNKKAVIEEVMICDSAGNEKKVFKQDEGMHILIRYYAKENINDPMFGIAIHKSEGMHVTGPNNILAGQRIESINGRGSVTYDVGSLPLITGKYFLTAAIYDTNGVTPLDHHNKMYSFIVEGGKEKYGCVTLKGRWGFEK